MGDVATIVSVGHEVLAGAIEGLHIYGRYKEHRLESLRETLLAEIGHGNLHFASEDDVVEVAVRVQQASVLGAGRVNLSLMARILNGMSERQPIYASDFARFQRMVSDLTREEIIFVATLQRETIVLGLPQDEHGEANARAAWEQTQNALVPGFFPSEAYMRAIAISAQRSGLLITGQTWDANGVLLPSPLLHELANLISLDESLWDEP